MEKHTITFTDFRANLYGMLNRMLETGEPLLLRRADRIVELRGKIKKAPGKKTAKKKIRDLSKIKRRKCMTMPAEWYISPNLMEWNGEIDPNLH